MCVCVNKQFLCKMLTCPHWSLCTYHGTHVSQCPSGQSGGPRRGAHTVGVSYANAWPCHNGRRDATRCWFDSLLWRLNQGLLTVQQRQPQGWEAFLLTSKKKRIKKECQSLQSKHITNMHEKTLNTAVGETMPCLLAASNKKEKDTHDHFCSSNFSSFKLSDLSHPQSLQLSCR